MNRRIRLFIIALLEIAWILIGLGVAILFTLRALFVFGNTGLFVGILLSIIFMAAIGGIIFLLVEMHYSLRIIENTVLEDLQEMKVILGKLAKIDYRLYELFYEQFYGSSNAEMELGRETDVNERVDLERQ